MMNSAMKQKPKKCQQNQSTLHFRNFLVTYELKYTRNRDRYNERRNNRLCRKEIETMIRLQSKVAQERKQSDCHHCFLN